MAPDPALDVDPDPALSVDLDPAFGMDSDVYLRLKDLDPTLVGKEVEKYSIKNEASTCTVCPLVY
jgi:hypothetical protein